MTQFVQFVRSIEGHFLSETLLRLGLAAVLGGMIGLEREIRRKPAGLRTNMFICFGSAMFTVMSYKLASMYAGDHTRIAAQIIPGIGFIGAGSILHSRGAVTGLTTAATIFVVASIGMAAGGGLYLPALFATVLILLALIILAVLEERFGLKPMLQAYEAVGADAEGVISAVNEILEDEQKAMQTVQVSRTDHQYRILFKVDATRNEHEALMQRFRQSPTFARIAALGEPEKE
jgi:putative Mg2+ transporter-C (MgtC) family protein